MSGTKEGGRKTALTNKRKYGADYYKNIGAEGGKLGRTGGFASLKISEDGMTGPERAVVAGVKGGRISKRGSSKTRVEVAPILLPAKRSIFDRLFFRKVERG